MDDYCEDCATCRCDTTDSTCPHATSHRAARIDALAERLTRKSAYEVYKPFLPWFDHGFWVKSSDLIMPRRRNRDG